MAQYEEKNQLDYRQGGDTVDDFAQKYMAEMTRVFRFLNDLRSNTTNSTEYTEPVANQLKVEDGKLYIRNATNTEWVLLGSVDTNFGFKPAAATFISTDDLSTEKIATINDLDMTKAVTTDELPTTKIDDVNALDFSTVVTTDNLPQTKIDTINSVAIDKTVTTENLPQSKIDNINALDFSTVITTDDVAEATGTGVVGKLLKTNEDGLLNADITGNAAKLAGIRVASDIIQDGQVLTYRSATNTWTNENKGVIGSGKALNLYDGDTLLCSYVGDETRDFDLGITANKQYVIDNVDGKAPLESPALTGTPTAPTAAAGTATTQIATTAFVDTAASNAVTTAGTNVDAKIATHNADTTAHSTQFAQYLPLSGGTMTNAIVFNNSSGGVMKMADDTSMIRLNGASTAANGATAFFCGKDFANTTYAGAFSIEAHSASAAVALFGKPDGTLTWAGNNVATTNKLSMPAGQGIIFTLPTLTDGWNTNVYTAPCDGFVHIDAVFSASCRVIIGSSGTGVSGQAGNGITASSGTYNFILPVAKGQTFKIYASTIANVSFSSSIFIYALSAT